MNILGIDPGASGLSHRTPTVAKHGWCLLEFVRGQRPVWVEAGHDSHDFFVHLPFAPNVVVVERPSGYVHEHARGAALLETAYEAGRLVSLLDPKRSVHTLSPEQWRLAVVGTRAPSDAMVKRALSLRMVLPKSSNAHQRDACGVALGWALRSPP